MKWILGIVSALIIVAAVALFVIPAKAPTTQEPVRASIENVITVDAPAIGATVSSPLVTSGTARGWYFEASFPVELRDAGGNILAQGYAQAQSDWMTAEFVRFESIPLVFAPQPSGSKGMLILRKDNPSGLPENDQSLEIPVVF